MATPRLPIAALFCSTAVALASPAFAQQPTLQRFTVPGADVTYARGIDAQGNVAGSYLPPGGVFRGYLRDASGAVQLLDWPGGTRTFFEGMTSGGTALGFAVGPGSSGPVEYFGGNWTALTPPPQSSVFLQGGNDAGLRVGHLIASDASRHGVLFTNGVATLLDFPGANSTELESVNASGIVVGNYESNSPGDWHGFVHDMGAGTFTTLDMPGAGWTRLRGSNDQGDIVGEALFGGQRRAILYSGGQWSELDLFGVLGDSLAADIANDGRICGEYFGEFQGAITILGYVLDPNGSGPARYCDSTPNSSGAAADIHFAGSTSLSANDLVLEAGPAPPNVSGLFFYGQNQVQVPFGDGFLCVGAPQFRLAVGTTDAQGFALHAFDSGAASVPLTAGTRLHFQYWFRDTAAAGAGFNTSRALAVEFRP